MDLTLGLSYDNMQLRQGSIGASETRIVVNGDDADVYKLWQMKRDPDLRADFERECAESLLMQLGHATEERHLEFARRRMNTEIGRAGEFVTHPDFPGLHCTLDGFIEELQPSEFANRPDEWAFSWGCNKPAGTVRAVFEMKRRNAQAFRLDEQIGRFMPQLHQSMALTDCRYAVLSTLVESKIWAHVVAFDRFYWAECEARARDFAAAVESSEPPRKWPALKPPAGNVKLATVARVVDMTKDRRANQWGMGVGELLENAPTDAESAKDKRFEKAKTYLKTLIDKDVTEASGGGVTAVRDRAGKVSFRIDPAALKKHRDLGAPDPNQIDLEEAIAARG